jgi:anti-sigma regulatory factor (Ser/Thr protein kinase)
LSQSDFSVSFEARPEWVAMVRRGVETLLGGDADGRLVGDVKAGVTEACMNAVRHAYPDHTGRVEVRAWLESQRLRVSVRDFGQGLIPSDPGRTGPGFGMPLMEELSSGVEIFSEPGQGTEVVLQFDLPGGGQQGRGPEPTPLLTALPA